jgi:hypothetical protein
LNNPSLFEEVISSFFSHAYRLQRVSERLIVFQAFSGTARFLVAFRSKGEGPSYHKNTGVWEFGIDAPELAGYRTIANLHRIPMYIFFLDDKNSAIYFIDLQNIDSVSRYWEDAVNFQNGIYFVRLSALMSFNKFHGVFSAEGTTQSSILEW